MKAARMFDSSGDPPGPCLRQRPFGEDIEASFRDVPSKQSRTRLRTSGGHARHSQAAHLPDQVHCGPARIALARAEARPRLSLFRSARDCMAEMEATMTWKALPRGRYLLAVRHVRLHMRPTCFEFYRSAPG